MAYQFSGLFVSTQANSIQELLAVTKGMCRYCPSLNHLYAINLHNESKLSAKVWNPLDHPIREWCSRNAKSVVVYTYIECFGGDCEEAGFVIQGDSVIHIEPLTDDYERDNSPLTRLIKYLGIELDNGIFEPLHREFFNTQEDY